MGSFTDLRCDPDVMKNAESDVIGTLSDTDAEDLKLVASKDKLLQDLTAALRYNKSDSDDLAKVDTIISGNESRFQTVLMYLQLWYYFREVFNIEGDQDYLRMLDYERLYKAERNGFADLSPDTTKTTTTLTMVLRG